MASEKDRWWCEGCKLELRPHEVYGSNEDGWECLKQHYHTVYFLPAAALDAHTAEMGSMIVTYIVENCATSADTWTVEPSELADAIHALVTIRALAPRKDG